MNDETAIHDLGYRRYDGPRDGAREAWGALFIQGLRTMFGLGRSAKAKVVPVAVFVITILPALASILAASASGGQFPVRYASVFSTSVFLYTLFIAAQAPEIFSRDQQHRVLPLVLTRATTRRGYASARLAAVLTALFLLIFACYFLMYLGEIGLAKDPVKTFGEMGDRIFPVLGLSGLTALALGSIGAAVAAWTPRRAFATAAIIGLFLVLAAVSTGMSQLAGLSSRASELVDPIRSLRTLAPLLFGETTRGIELEAPMDVSTYIG
ncbi:MAG: hypothetical protein M3Y64_11105, partial [Gemmatimonadota bacterium]|nr:hypothetical protein [Gemmatimonadota bacterium]